jgi:transposase
MADYLQSLGVTHVALEATGVLWKPVWNILDGRFTLLLVNPRHLKKVPGRKSDVTDAEWIAQLLQHGLLRGSFVPPRAVRELRDLTRHRAQLAAEQTRVANRIHKVLEDCNIKLGAVASDVLGELLSYIRAMLYHERSESEQNRLQEVMENSVQDEATRQEVRKMRKTGAQALMERGAHKAGLLTRQQTLVRLLRKRFGSIPSEVVSVVEATDDVDQLDNWLDRFATAQTLEELGIGDQV